MQKGQPAQGTQADKKAAQLPPPVSGTTCPGGRHGVDGIKAAVEAGHCGDMNNSAA